VATVRSADALHLLALLVAQRGDEDERLTLLAEVATRAPDDALAHLALGLSDRLPELERAAHLRRVLRLTQRRADEPLPGPEPLPASWVRKVAASMLRQLHGETT
jgi:hypothetical protein